MNIFFISDNGTPLPEQFNTQQEAETWVKHTFDLDYAYLIKIHQATTDEHLALLTIDEMAHHEIKNNLLDLIERESTGKPKEVVFATLAQLDGDYGKKYFDYYIAKEFGLGEGSSCFYDIQPIQPILTYTQFLEREIQKIQEIIASL